MGTTRAGRKRKHGVVRQPDGRTHPSSRDDPTATATLRRLREALVRDVTHPWYGFPLGRLALEKYITGDEYDAGRAWAELTWRHAQIVGIMLPKCKAINWEGAQGRSLAKEPGEDHIAQVKERKYRADQQIHHAGWQAMEECKRVILCDEEPQDRQLLRKALRNMVDK